jgi:hypothetical protein
MICLSEALVNRTNPVIDKAQTDCYSSTMIVRQILLCGALSAILGATEIGPKANVNLVRVPNGGEAVDAKVSSDGMIHLLYQLQDIPYYVKSSDNGASFSAPIPVVASEARKPDLVFAGSSLAIGKGGAVYVVMMTNNWKTKLPGVPEGFVYSNLPPGTKAFQPIRSLNNKPSEGFSVAADEKGNVAATWLSGKLYANTSHDSGKTFTGNAEINPTYDPCDCCTTRAAYAPDGSLAVLYREETRNQRDMYLVIIGKDGRERRTRVSETSWSLNGCPMTYYALSATRDGYIAAWPTKGEIYFTRLDKAGNRMAPGEIKTPGHSGMRTGVTALSAPDGKTLIAWKHQDELGWQAYDEKGHADGAPGSVKSAGKGTAGIVDRNGRFILFQ